MNVDPSTEPLDEYGDPFFDSGPLDLLNLREAYIDDEGRFKRATKTNSTRGEDLSHLLGPLDPDPPTGKEISALQGNAAPVTDEPAAMPAAGGITTPNAQQAPTSTGSIIAADLFTRQRQQAGARAGRLTPIPGVSASPSNAPQAASAGNSTHAQAGAAPTAISTVNDVPAAMQANATTGQGEQGSEVAKPQASGRGRGRGRGSSRARGRGGRARSNGGRGRGGKGGRGRSRGRGAGASEV